MTENNIVVQYFKRLGALRIGLLILAAIVLALRPETGAQVSYEGWAFVPTLLIPTLAPLIFMGFLLDALMTAVMAGSMEGAQRTRLKAALWTDLVVAVVLAVVWVPFFMALGN